MTTDASARFFGSPEALRAMIAGQEVAARASRATTAVLTPEEAFEGALDLWSLCPERLVSPPDAVRMRETGEARVAWGKLKARFAK